MFGPNKVVSDMLENNSTHRGTIFQKLYKKFEYEFNKKFIDASVIGCEYDVILIPGSGSMAMETVLRSLQLPVKFPEDGGKFHERWNSIYHDRGGGVLDYFKPNNSNLKGICLFETSISGYNDTTGYNVVDAISGFPYYNIDKSVEFIITCANKQLGSYPGISIILAKPGLGFYAFNKKSKTFSVTDFSRHFEMYNKYETPYTISSAHVAHLLKCVTSFDVARHNEQINTNANKIIAAVRASCKISDYHGDPFIGDVYSPCVTIKQGIVKDSVIENNNLYKSFQGGVHAFTYSEPKEHYDTFKHKI